MKRIPLLCCLLIAMPAQAEWGRLFYTPQERSEIDRGGHAAVTAKTNKPTLHRFDGEASYNGHVPLRWIDGKAVEHRQPVAVKPGERWDPSTGKVYPAGRGPNGRLP